MLITWTWSTINLKGWETDKEIEDDDFNWALCSDVLDLHSFAECRLLIFEILLDEAMDEDEDKEEESDADESLLDDVWGDEYELDVNVAGNNLDKV